MSSVFLKNKRMMSKKSICNATEQDTNFDHKGGNRRIFEWVEMLV
jgi:hypothetical protein